MTRPGQVGADVDQVLILHRWTEDCVDYAAFVDHTRHAVRYLTSPEAAATVPPTAATVQTVASMDQAALAIRAGRAMAARFGVPHRIVALHEADLETAAALRGRLGIAGRTLAETVVFRDKLTMVQRMAGAGLRVPAFAAVSGRGDVERFAAEAGYPLVVKPRRGMGSRGTTRIARADDLAALPAEFAEPCLVQSFVPDQVHHVDGVWTGSGLGPWRLSRYVDTWYSRPLGPQLASVEVDDEALLPAIGAFTHAVLAALSHQPRVFHLELFVGERTDDITFLEVGGRAGGGEIPFVWRDVHGLDLLGTDLLLQLGVELAEAYRHPTAPARVAGWLEVAPAGHHPRRLAAIPPTASIGPEVYWHEIAEIGQEISPDAAYPTYFARLRLAGASTAAVERAIWDISARFQFGSATLAEDARP
jgi:hypothetical protein